MDDPRPLLRTAYRDLGALLAALPDDDAFTPTGCTGWAVVDLTHHLLGDARRALVALATPADGPPDTTAVSYWQQAPDSPGSGDDLWPVRAAASLMGGFDAVRGAHAEASAAVLA